MSSSSSVTAMPCHLSRCGSVTLAGKQRTVLFSNTLVPLRYPVLGKAFAIAPVDKLKELVK